MRNLKSYVVHMNIKHAKAYVGINQAGKKTNCNEDDTINGNLSEINYSCRVTWIWQFFCPEQFHFLCWHHCRLDLLLIL